MRLKTIFKLLVLGGIALVIALIAVAKSIDVNRYRQFLAESAQAATGRDLRIDGPIKLNLSLTPSLTAEDIVFTNAAWGSRPEMVKIKRIEAQIGLVPLLFREVAIRRLVVIEPDVLLEQDGKGHANWQFNAAAPDQIPSAASTGVPTNFRVGRVRVQGGRVQYRDAKTGVLHDIVIQRFTADADTLISPMGVKLAGKWNEKAVDISGVLGPIGELWGSPRLHVQPYPIKLKAVLPGMLATIDGSISGDKLGNPALALKVTADAADLAEAARLVGLTAPALGAARLSMTVGGVASAPSFSDIDAALGRKDAAALTLKGSVKQPLTAKGIDLVLTVEGTNLAGFNKPLGLSLPALGPLKGSGRLRNEGAGWKISDLKAAIGHSDLAGDVVLRVDNARPTLDAHLISGIIDVEEALHGEPVKPGVPDGRVFSDQPLPFFWLNVMDGSVAWKIDRLKDGPLLIQGVELNATLAAGKLQAAANAALLAGGKAKGKIGIDSLASPPSLDLTISADKIGLGEVLRGLEATPVLSGGRTDLRAVLQATGETPHAIMAKLNGETAIVTDKGAIEGTNPDALASDVIHQLSPWNTERDADMQCMVSRFVISDGLAKAESLLLDTSRMTVGGHGSINLGNETLDLTLTPRPKDANLLALAIPLDVSGSLLEPAIAPNKGAIVKGAAGAMGTLGPFVPVVNAGTGGANPCLSAIAQAHKAPPATGRRPGKGKKADIEKPEAGLDGLLQGLLGN